MITNSQVDQLIALFQRFVVVEEEKLQLSKIVLAQRAELDLRAVAAQEKAANGNVSLGVVGPVAVHHSQGG